MKGVSGQREGTETSLFREKAHPDSGKFDSLGVDRSQVHGRGQVAGTVVVGKGRLTSAAYALLSPHLASMLTRLLPHLWFLSPTPALWSGSPCRQPPPRIITGMLILPGSPFPVCRPSPHHPRPVPPRLISCHYLGLS